MNSCHKLLKKSRRWLAMDMKEGMALSRLLGCVWNLTQLENIRHISN